MTPKPRIRRLLYPALTGAWEKPIIRWLGFSRLESYVQFPVPQITTFLLLLHMAFGCCMHHAHTCEVNCCPEPTAVAEACACGTHEEADHEGESANEDAEPANHPAKHHCSGDHCTFVQSQPSPEQMGEFVADFCPIEAVVTTDDVDEFRSQLDRSQDQHILHAGTSLRSHLALRVLLI